MEEIAKSESEEIQIYCGRKNINLAQFSHDPDCHHSIMCVKVMFIREVRWVAAQNEE